MPSHITHVSAERLRTRVPTAGCCDCTNEVDTADDEEVWTIFHPSDVLRYYCPECAEHEGIGHI